jgi:hypothetical protein
LSAVGLLLDLLDQPDSILAGPVMADYFAVDGASLLRAGLLVADGHEPADSTGEHDDVPVALTWSDDMQTHGYFDRRSGWVSVEAARLARYRIDRNSVVERLTGNASSGVRVAIESGIDAIWVLGKVRVRGHRRLVPALLLRCVSDARTWKMIRKWLVENPAVDLRLLMCASHGEGLPDDPPHGNVLMSLANVIDGYFRLDPRIVAARLDLAAGAEQSTGPLAVFGDGRVVRLYGMVFRFPAGDTQRRIVCALHRHYLNGEREVATAAIVSEARLRENARIRDHFKHHRPPVLDRLLWERDGLCGFCLKR